MPRVLWQMLNREWRRLYPTVPVTVAVAATTVADAIQHIRRHLAFYVHDGGEVALAFAAARCRRPRDN